jgi:probable HAF family extracellular repeat protein
MNHHQNMLLGLILGAMAPLVAAEPVTYAVTDLGTIGGLDVTTSPGVAALGIAANGGMVVGQAIVDDDLGPLHAFSWSVSGGLVDLGTVDGLPHSIARAVNGSGTIVGVSFRLGDLDGTAVRWMNGIPEALGAFSPRDLNDAGVIVGEAGLPSHAVRWTNGSLVNLGTLGGPQSAAYAIANTGRVVGSSLLAGNGGPHAFLSDGGGPIDLGTLGGARSQAADVSPGGQYVAGLAQRSDGIMHAVRYAIAANGTVTSVTDLGELGGSYSAATAVNDFGHVVGVSDSRAFVWDGVEMSDLNEMIAPSSGWSLWKATGISNDGRIVGAGVVNGRQRAFLLTPLTSGDLDGNGIVDAADLAILLASWGPCPGCPADLDGDGTVGPADLSILLANWGA